MRDDDWGDVDVTGDPALDQQGYETPLRRGQNLGGFTGHGPAPGLGRADEMRARRRQRREGAGPREPEPPPPPPPSGHVVSPVPVQPVGEPPGQPDTHLPMPGQHGAYFERRAVRVWWKPWKKRYVWQQISAWNAGLPPASPGEMVTVADVAELPGKVRTIGTVGPTGAVLY